MIRIEKLFNMCDKNDFSLIRMLLEGFSHSAVAEKLFMSTNGIKYRLKSMYEVCRVESKAGFLELVGKYITFEQEEKKKSR